MKATLAATALYATLAVAQSNSTILCMDISNNVIQTPSICSGPGSKELGKGVCCITTAEAEANFDSACDDANGTAQKTGESCSF
ncbi:hypothetical protein LZ31DRAFT_558943 [Colletotrichum somersetense]|nr:hypothetical protein LZ31DRAFT_558943 [Colletotrichum somersetense]